MKKLYIIGSGGFSKQVIEMVEKLNEYEETYDLIGLIDDDEKKIDERVLGYKVLGATEKLNGISETEIVYAVIAIAEGSIRKEIVNKLDNVNWVNLIHPDSVISKYVQLGKGNIICAGTIINPECIFGDHCHINIGSTFGHDVVVENYVTIMPGSNISGNVTLKSKSMIGTGAIIIQGIHIEKKVIIGAGATVVKHTEKQNIYVGTPAIMVKK